MNNKISIVIPIFNKEKFLNRCIDSVINQTYRNIEIILVNDGSTDNSLNICNEYKKYNNIKVINKENGGVSDARNVGIENSNGEYITFIDPDDCVSETYIENLYKRIIKYRADIAIENPIKYRNGEEIHRNIKIDDDIILEKKDQFLIELFNAKYFHNTCWGKIYNNQLVKKVKFDINMSIGEDLKFLVEIFTMANKIVITDLEEYYYYENIGSLTRVGFNEAWLKEIKYCNELIHKYKNSNIRIYAIKRYIDVNLGCAIRFKLDKKSIKNIKNNIKKYINEYMNSTIIDKKMKAKVKLLIFSYHIFMFLYIINNYNKNESF